MTERGYFGIGIYHTKNVLNVGGLFRSAQAFGASFIFTVGKRYKRQASDTTKTWRHTPLMHFKTVDQIPSFYNCQLIGIEQTDDISENLCEFKHPDRAIYLLGAEDYGLPKEILDRCHSVVEIPTIRCINVAVAGSVIMYDRRMKTTCQKR